MNGNKGLLVVDVQFGMFNLPVPLYNGENLLDNISKLIEKARSINIPVIFFQHCGKEKSVFEDGTINWRIHPKITLHQDDIVIQKKYSDSFQETNLENILKSLSISHLVVCGLVTEGCIDTTVRRAYSLGFKIELASDCHSTTDSTILKAEQIIKHHNEVLKIFAEVKASGEIFI